MSSPILILTATAFEQAELRNSLQNAASQVLSHRVWTRGHLNGRPVVLLEGGIGQVNTAQALTTALDRIHPSLVLQVGIGGAYLNSDLKIGDLALATEENYGDMGVITPKGWQPADVIGIPVLQKESDYYNTFPLNTEHVTVADTLLRQRDETPSLQSGPFVTVQQCSNRTIGDELATRFSAICENMEGVAAAHLCTLYEIPFLELRAISNCVEDYNKEAWDIPLALARSQNAARHLIQHLSI
ncbi:MAG: futalosine hydrolase [bacterium]|nr:futalosine hydrolase [bacterium]